MFGGATGPFRLLQSGLGDQAGWLLGFAVVSGLAILVLSRLRRRDPRTGWLIVVGGAFLTTAVVFSFASGIFHPYYVSLLAPFTAALVGAGVGLCVSERSSARVIAPLAILAGVLTELVVLGELTGQLGWAVPLAVGAGLGGAALLALRLPARLRAALVAVALAALLTAPATWAADTLGHAAGSTFPAGGAASASGFAPSGAGRGFGPPPGFGRTRGFGPPPGFGGTRGFAPPGAVSGAGAFGGDSAGLTAAIAYVKAHGGGTIGVESQSSAAAAILSSDADVAGLGGFSGRESSVTAKWLAAEVRSGRLRWILVDSGQGGGGLPGDTRAGSQSAFAAVAKACPSITLSSGVTLYDCAGHASAIAA